MAGSEMRVWNAAMPANWTVLRHDQPPARTCGMGAHIPREGLRDLHGDDAREEPARHAPVLVRRREHRDECREERDEGHAGRERGEPGRKWAAGGPARGERAAGELERRVERGGEREFLAREPMLLELERGRGVVRAEGDLGEHVDREERLDVCAGVSEARDGRRGGNGRGS
jgi:hypothetical protein